MLYDLVKKNRSYRRFYEDTPIREDILKSLVDMARLTASGGNRQALRYYLTADAAQTARIFPQLHWAAYLKDWEGPVPGERPTGYIILTQRNDFKMGTPYDAGIAAQTILLGAVEAGFGGCILASVQREKIKALLKLPADVEILLVLALGKPKEEIVIDEIDPEGSIKYYRDEKQIHHVPKRKLKDILL